MRMKTLVSFLYKVYILLLLLYVCIFHFRYHPHEVVKKSDYEALQNAHEEKIKDYEAVKKQYAKVASDYANLHVENRENALAALNTSTINENLELVSNSALSHRSISYIILLIVIYIMHAE